MKYLIIGLLFLSIASYSSCNKFLEEKPKSNIPVGEYFNTLEEAQSAVNYLYNHGTGIENFYGQHGTLYDGTNTFTLDAMSGLSNNPVAQDPSIRNFASLTQNASNSDSYLDDIWSSFYKNVANANTIIVNLEKNKDIDTKDKAPLIATAKFFRAVDYYYLVRLFGAVPLILKPYTSVEDINTPRASVDSVYNAIVDDLEWALKHGNLPDKPMGANNNKITKGTVQVILAEAYLTMAGYPLEKGKEYYKKALTVADKLLQSTGGYALFNHSGGTTAFDKLRLTSFDQGDEYLFFVEYDPTIQSSSFTEYTLPNTFPSSVPKSNLEIQYTLVVQSWTPSDLLLNMYDSTNDIRRHEGQFYHSEFKYQTQEGTTASIHFQEMPYRWFDSTALFSTATSGKYFAAYRLADAYLIAAEAANALGQDPTPYLNPILKRAYVDVPTIPTAPTERRDMILAERYRELAMEGHFWFDMLRTRLYPEVDENHNVTFSSLIGHSNGRGQTFEKKDLLLPIPITEMERDPELTQNPGY